MRHSFFRAVGLVLTIGLAFAGVAQAQQGTRSQTQQATKTQQAQQATKKQAQQATKTQAQQTPAPAPAATPSQNQIGPQAPQPGIDAPPPAGSNASDYIIGPGDMLQIFVWRNPELSVTVPVRPDGKISTPLVENMLAIGKSPSQLARDMETVLSEFVRSPQVNVIVSQALSSFSSVKVVGQVRAPQSVPFREGLRVIDVVLASGGLTEFAAPGRAKIVRKDGEKQTEIKVNLSKLMNKGDLSQNHALRPGDVLIVPQSLF